MLEFPIHSELRFTLRMFCRVMGGRKIAFFIIVQGIMFTEHATCTNSALFKTRENTRLNGHVVKQFFKNRNLYMFLLYQGFTSETQICPAGGKIIFCL